MFNLTSKALARFNFDNATVQNVVEGGTIQLPNATDNSCCIDINGGDISIRRGGTYKVSVNVTTVATAAGVEEVQLFEDGTAKPGAHARETAAAVGDSTSMSFSTLVTVDNNGKTTLSLRTAVATSISIANVVLEQVD